MNADIALWFTVGALVVAVALAAYHIAAARRLRGRVAGLEEACAARDAAVGQLVGLGLPTVADARCGDTSAARGSLSLAPSLGGTAFAGNVGVLAQRYTAGVSDLQREIALTVRERVEEEAKQTTESAVRSFAETVVSLGASLSKVVAEAMRKHRGDETFETLTLIDHTVQQMIRQAQSYVVVCGGLPGRRWPAQSMTDVVRGAMGRIQDYQRIRPRELSRQVVGQAVEPAVHAVATLLDNAARYSPPGSFVDVTFQEGHHGVTVIVDDAGVGMNSEQLDSARRILSGQEPVDLHRFGPHPKIGFPTVAALSKRYGFQASIDGSSSPFGGTRAALFIPEALLASDVVDGNGVNGNGNGATPEQTSATSATAATSATLSSATATATVSAFAPKPSPPEPELTETGLPRRKRHSATTDTQPLPPVLSTTQPRPSVAAAWQSGAHGADGAHDAPGAHGADGAHDAPRAHGADRAATPSDPAEGTR